MSTFDFFLIAVILKGFKHQAKVSQPNAVAVQQRPVAILHG